MINFIMGILVMVIYNIIRGKKCKCSKKVKTPKEFNINGYSKNKGISEITLYIDDAVCNAVCYDDEITIQTKDVNLYKSLHKWITLASFEKLAKYYKKDLNFESNAYKGIMLGCFPTFVNNLNDSKYIITLSYDGCKI